MKNLHTDNYRAHNDYDQTNVSGEIAYPYSSGTLQFNYKIGREKMLYPGALSATEVNEDRRAASNDTDFFSDWNGFFHLRHLQTINDDWMIQTDMTRRTMNGNGVLFSPFTQTRVIDFLKPTVKGKLGAVLTESGVDFENDHYTLDTDFGDTFDKLKKYGIFGLIKIPAAEKVTISLGVRAATQYSDLQSPDDIHTKNNATATTLDGIYQYNENTSFYLRRAGSFRFPKADEMASTTPGTILKTQQGVAYEAGSSVNIFQLHSQLSLYQLNLKDEITFDPTQTEQDPFGTNRNLPPTTRTGFSINEKYVITPDIMLNGQYHYVNARFSSGVNVGKQIPLVAENIFHFGIDYHFLENWNFFSEAIYTGSQFPSNDDANVSHKIGGYTIYNFNLHYQFQHFSASFRLNNLTNKFYNLYTVYTPTTNTESFYPAPGRNFFLTLKYEWT
jgi:iron complex outermembrane receptor protein